MNLLLYIKQNKVLSSTVLSIICFCIVYIVIFNNRIRRFLEPMTGIKQIVNITPLSRNSKIMNGNYKLCDFHIAASYKSYLPCTNYIDYSSIDSIREILRCGCRYIDIDVMNSTFGNTAKPVVCNGNPIGNWHYTTALEFKAVIRFIMTFAFNGQVSNKDDPLILNINFNTWYNKETINIGPDEETATILELSKLVANETGYNGNPIFIKDRPKEVKFASCSSDKARKLLGYETKTSLKESIKLTADFVRQRGIKKFDYNLPLEINSEITPETWKFKKI